VLAPGKIRNHQQVLDPEIVISSGYPGIPALSALK
jgi:hypothetical protein